MKIFRLFLLSLLLAISTIQTNAQRDPVDRTTGLKIHPCEGVRCGEENEDHNGEDIYCLKCLLHTADSTMSSEFKNLFTNINKRKTKRQFQENQDKWEMDTNKKAGEHSNEYKGGAMKVTEFIRMKLLLTQKRILFLRNYKVE